MHVSPHPIISQMSYLKIKVGFIPRFFFFDKRCEKNETKKKKKNPTC